MRGETFWKLARFAGDALDGLIAPKDEGDGGDGGMGVSDYAQPPTIQSGDGHSETRKGRIATLSLNDTFWRLEMGYPYAAACPLRKTMPGCRVD